jgi:hypothetical protein
MIEVEVYDEFSEEVKKQAAEDMIVDMSLENVSGSESDEDDLNISIEVETYDEFREEVKKQAAEDMIGNMSLENVSSSEDSEDELNITIEESSSIGITVEEASSDEGRSVLAVKESHGDTVFAGDGLISKLRFNNVVSLISDKEEVSTVLDSVREFVSADEYGLRRRIVVSAGNYNITSKGCGIEASHLTAEQRNGTVHRVVMKVINTLRVFREEVLKEGGEVLVLLPIPLPREVDPTYEYNTPVVQDLLSRVYLKLASEIRKFNTLGGVSTISVSRYLEEKNFMKKKKKGEKKGLLRREKTFYKGRDQRKVKTEYYDSEGMGLNDKGHRLVTGVLEDILADKE